MMTLLLCADLMFLETSALSGENVEEAFLKCTRTILAKIESGDNNLTAFKRNAKAFMLNAIVDVRLSRHEMIFL